LTISANFGYNALIQKTSRLGLIMNLGSSTFLFFVSALGLGMTTGCSVEAKKESEEYSYEFSQQINFKKCTTSRQTFSSKADYCSGLKDEARNNYCAQDERRKVYSSSCGSDFDPAPAATPDSTQLLPQNSPQPPKPATPATPPPAVEPKGVEAELKAAGIELDTYNDGMPTLPGDETFHSKLNKFMPRLEAVKNQLILHRDVFNRIRLSSYADCSSSVNSLTLDVDFTDAELKEYLVLTYEKLAIEKNLSLEIETGIDSTFRGANLDEFRKKMEFVRSNKALNTISKIAKKLDLSEEKFQFRLYDQILKVDEKQYVDQVEKFADELRSFRPFFVWADENKISLEGDLNYADQPEIARELFRQALELRNDLKTLKELKGLKEIEFSNNATKPHFYSGSLKFAAASPTDLSKNTPIIKAISYQAEASKLLGQEVAPLTFEYNMNFVTAVNRLRANFSTIQKKITKLQRINFAQKSSFSFGTLTIGYDDKEVDLITVLNKI